MSDNPRVHLDGDSNGDLIALNQVRPDNSSYGENVVVQPAEEVIDDMNIAETGVIGSDEMLVPLPQHSIAKSSTSKRKKGSKKHKRLDIDKKVAKKWEQKQVQIKTLEGEFSVTMWASGKQFYKGKQYSKQFN